MQHIQVPYQQAVSYLSTVAEVAQCLNNQHRHRLQAVPWPAFPYQPEVSFSIAHHIDCIFLKYYIKEKSIRAHYTVTNEPVYEDSCVEFFISFDDSGYYNLEVNSLGTCLMGFGKDKIGRQLLPAKIIEKIKSQTVINRNSDACIEWEITLLIPMEMFYHHTIASLTGKNCRANFYKCGDQLPQPHFICWNPIEAPEPNFHLSQFFGTITFL